MGSPPRLADRRRFLALSGSAVVAGLGQAACARRTRHSVESTNDRAAPMAFPPGKNRDDFIVHDTTPPVIEPRRSRLGHRALTPTELIYVLAHNPIANRPVTPNDEGWTVRFEGVARPRTLTLAQLKRLGEVTVPAVLQCAGNGRTAFRHGPRGIQWSHGAVACAEWTGVTLRTVIEALGGPESARPYLTVTGHDPCASGRRSLLIERSIPADKALEDCLLAWKLNGEDLPLVHGGPLRFVAPGYYGVNQVKYAAKLAFTAAQSDARLQRIDYRIRPVGVAPESDQPTCWDIDVQSTITSPMAETARPGAISVEGFAVPGKSAVERVEVSVDGGASWREAQLLEPDLGPYAWRRFRFSFDAKPGRYVLASRARDRAGRSQPERPPANEGGYANNAWGDRTIAMAVG